MLEELSKRDLKIYTIPDYHIFYIPGKLGSRTSFSKIELWKRLYGTLKYEKLLSFFGFVMDAGFNEAKFFFDDASGELWYGNKLDVENVLLDHNFHPSQRAELKNFITEQVFKNLTSEEFHQTFKFNIVLPEKIDKRKKYCSNEQKQGIIEIFKEIKSFIVEYANLYAQDANELWKKKFENKKIVLQQSIDALDRIISQSEAGNMRDFELLIHARVLMYQLNKKS